MVRSGFGRSSGLHQIELLDQNQEHQSSDPIGKVIGSVFVGSAKATGSSGGLISGSGSELGTDAGGGVVVGIL